MRGILKRRHKDQQRGRFYCRLIAVATDHLCQRDNLFFAYILSVGFKALEILNDVLACICATHEFSKPRIIRLQSVTNNRPALRIDLRVVQDRLRSMRDGAYKDA
jgi:hypothetical protein